MSGIVPPPPDGSRRPVAIALGLGLLVLPVVALLLSRALPGVVILVAVIVTAVAVGIAGITVLASERQRARSKALKHKRRPQGADMYTLIDRMVGDLDEDEAAYLRRRLDQLEAGLQTDLPADVDDLLRQRKRGRRAGRR